MKHLKTISLALFIGAIIFLASSCDEELKETTIINDTTIIVNNDTTIVMVSSEEWEALEESATPSNLLDLASGFESVEIEVLMSSEDQLPSAPEFVYGSMADGAGLLANSDDTYTLINNIEADYSIARLTLNADLRPLYGEYIVNATATAFTAMCSGSMITPEEHGFGPLYLSGGEWGGGSNGVFAVSPYRSTNDAGLADMLPKWGQWSTENAVVIGKDAFPSNTVGFIGDDHSDDNEPSGQLGMYVGGYGDIHNGQLYGLAVTADGIDYEVDMVEGQSYTATFVELNETSLDLLDAEAKEKGVMGFSRLEDIDWRRGSAANQREIYFCVTGRAKDGLVDKGTFYGRVYKVVLHEEMLNSESENYMSATITCVLDGDLTDGEASAFMSPDNITVTENYAYIQEDPNTHPSNESGDKVHYARLYQYNLETGELKTVLECNQEVAEEAGYGVASSTWELTGMIDVTETIGSSESTFLIMTQNHGWEEATPFTDPKANPNIEASRAEGSVLYILRGLDR